MTIDHDPEKQVFYTDYQKHKGELRYRVKDKQTLEYYSTYVPKPVRGRGIAGQITEFALNYARKEGLKVIPSCSFVATYIKRHPEYKNLVA